MISSLIVNLIGCCYFDTVCYREQLFAFWIVNRHPSRRTKNLSYKSQVMIIWSIPTHYTREIRLPSIFWSKHGHRILRPTISTECRVISDLSTVSKYFRETHPALQPWTTTKRWRWKLSRSDFIFSISTVMMGLRLVGFVSAAALALLGVLSLDTSWTTATEWWSEWEVNVLLGVKSDNVWWDIDNLKNTLPKLFDSKLSVKIPIWSVLEMRAHCIFIQKEFCTPQVGFIFISHSSEIVWISTNQSWSIQGTISVRTVVNLTCFLTRMCLCLIRTRAWWIDLASPSLKTIIG